MDTCPHCGGSITTPPLPSVWLSGTSLAAMLMGMLISVPGSWHWAWMLVGTGVGYLFGVFVEYKSRQAAKQEKP